MRGREREKLERGRKRATTKILRGGTFSFRKGPSFFCLLKKQPPCRFHM